MTLVLMLTRWPTISYLLLGLLCWWAYQTVFPERPELRINDQQFARALADWQQRYSRKPTAQERQRLLEQTIQDEVLYQQALEQGLQHSAVVQARIQKLNRYLALGAGEEGVAKPTWRAQDYLATDPLIRRYLVETAKQYLQRTVNIAPISDQQLRQYYQQHIERYRVPARYGFYHLYFGGFDPAALDRAQQVLKTLAPLPLEEALTRGEVFVGGQYDVPKTQQRIQQQLGGEIGRAVATLGLRTWSGPISSAYGRHLLYLKTVVEKTTPHFEEIKEQLRADWLNETRKKQALIEIDKRVQRYDIVVAISDV